MKRYMISKLHVVKRNIRLIVLPCLIFISLFLITHNLYAIRLTIKSVADFDALENALSITTTTGIPPTTQPPTIEERLKTLLNCKDRKLIQNKLQYGDYWLIQNFIRGEDSIEMGCAESITYTTNGDYTFFDNLAPLTKRWLAPISFAIFTPGYDINGTMDSIIHARNCLPESNLIRQYVTFHIYFPNNHMPKYVPLTEDAALKWNYTCNRPNNTAPYENIDRNIMYKTLKNLTYPINVGRNIARKAANTYFIFACDIELYPSLNFVPKFLEMVVNNQSVYFEGNENKLRVYPLPVFEIEKNQSIPDNKTELVKMLHTKMAINFHSKLCKTCHLVPNQTQWVNASESDTLSVFSTTKRIFAFKYWEPFYISDNREPMFDERVTWEGQSNKRIQNFAMCLMDYDYHVLHPGFLVHSPGIKRFDKKSPRYKYVPAMNKLIKRTIEPEYRILYGSNKNCRT